MAGVREALLQMLTEEQRISLEAVRGKLKVDPTALDTRKVEIPQEKVDG
jgi:hypothetical protein